MFTPPIYLLPISGPSSCLRVPSGLHSGRPPRRGEATDNRAPGQRRSTTFFCLVYLALCVLDDFGARLCMCTPPLCMCTCTCMAGTGVNTKVSIYAYANTEYSTREPPYHAGLPAGRRGALLMWLRAWMCAFACAGDGFVFSAYSQIWLSCIFVTAAWQLHVGFMKNFCGKNCSIDQVQQLHHTLLVMKMSCGPAVAVTKNLLFGKKIGRRGLSSLRRNQNRPAAPVP